MIELNKIYNENCLDTLTRMDDCSVDCVITSPPYWGLRDYGHSDQIGLEDSPDLYAEKLGNVFDEVRRVLKNDGTLWLNLGDSYYNYRGENNRRSDMDLSRRKTLQQNHHNILSRPNEMRQNHLKGKDLVGIPWLVAFELRKRGWWLRQDIIWQKLNPMPESVTDRCTKSHEYVFLFSKSRKYYYDHEAIKEPSYPESIQLKRKGVKTAPTEKINGIRNDTMCPEMANRRSVWTTATQSIEDAHFATYPIELIKPMVLAGSRKDGIIYDPFMGSGTTAIVALMYGRKFIGSELNADYMKIAEKRIRPYMQQPQLF